MFEDRIDVTEKADSMSTGCLIIGGGLAGCTLGYCLHKAGMDVLILEILDARKKDKLCAGVIDKESLGLLKSIFGPDTEEVLHPMHIEWIRSRVDGMETRRNSTARSLPQDVSSQGKIRK